MKNNKRETEKLPDPEFFIKNIIGGIHYVIKVKGFKTIIPLQNYLKDLIEGANLEKKLKDTYESMKNGNLNPLTYENDGYSIGESQILDCFIGMFIGMEYEGLSVKRDKLTEFAECMMFDRPNILMMAIATAPEELLK